MNISNGLGFRRSAMQSLSSIIKSINQYNTSFSTISYFERIRCTLNYNTITIKGGAEFAGPENKSSAVAGKPCEAV